MGINIEKIKKARAEKQFNSDMWNPPEGDTLIYVCPPCRPEDELPFYELRVHFGVGPKNAMAVCLDTSRNKILIHPFTSVALKEMGKDLAGGCPVCEHLDKAGDGDTEEEKKQRKDMRSQARYFFNLIPMRHRSNASAPWSPWPEPDKIQTLFCGYRVWDGISEQFISLGDLSDFDKAYLLKLSRKGTKLATQWTVQPDIETARDAMVLPKSTRAVIRAAQVAGSPFDIYSMCARMARSREDVEAIMTGVKVVEEEEVSEEKPAPARTAGEIKKAVAEAKAAAKAAPEADPEAARGPKPPCFSFDCSPADKQCQECPWKVECAPLCGVEVPPDVGAAAAPEAAPAPEAKPEAAPALMRAENCVAGAQYNTLDGTLVEYIGPAKGGHFFKSVADGKRVKLAPSDQVSASANGKGGHIASAAEPETKPAPASKPAPAAAAAVPETEDEKLAALEAELAASKAKRAASK